MEINLITKLIPTQTYLLTGKINNLKLIEKLKNSIRDKINLSDLHYKTYVKAKFTGFDALLNDLNFDYFIKSIENEIKVIYPYKFKMMDAWANICKQSEKVELHNHNGVTAFCGILYLTDGGPGTSFPEYNLTITEEVGRYVLFHPLLKHEVQIINSNLERITIAFNANECKIWEEK